MVKRTIKQTGQPAPQAARASDLKIDVYADGANLDEMRRLVNDPRVKGFTTNPTLMRAAGVERYRAFALKALEVARGKPISFEVVSDDFAEMERQARAIAEWGGSARNAYVKIPITNTRGEPSTGVIASLVADHVPVNVTAVFTPGQVDAICRAVGATTAPLIVSIFAGRVADAGVDPLSHVKKCVEVLRDSIPMARVLWASPRQVYDVVLAEAAGCDIITMTPTLLAKLDGFGRDLTEFSLDTVRMFDRDAQEAGYAL